MKTAKAFMVFSLICLLVSLGHTRVAAKSGDPFNFVTDVHWDEIDFQVEGICVCPRPPPVFFETGIIVSYWEPFLLEDTVSVAHYSAMQGQSMGSSAIDELGGKNKSSDAVEIANESTFDPMWQNDELSILIHPEAALFANKEMQMACMLDAGAVNLGHTLDFMPWCVGSGGSAYPMTGHVDNDNIVQANSTVAARLIYKLCRVGMICDPADNLCGCNPTPIWIKSHYKLHTARPANRSPAYPVGKSAKFYDTGLNPPYRGEQGSNDEFLWVVYRKQRCCTCCQ